MTDTSTEEEEIRVEVVVSSRGDENASDVGVRAKRLLLGQNVESFEDVSLRRFRYVGTGNE